MRSKQLPSPDTFFLRSDSVSSADTMEKLSALGSVEPLEGADGVLLRVANQQTDPRACWHAVRERAGLDAVNPVLLDEQGEPHLPTGEVTVRFASPPSDDTLDEFARRHGLELRQRNKYQPAQASFVFSAQEYLPDVVEALEPAENVVAVWANTKSKYRRS
jgi:hypothetical protein